MNEDSPRREPSSRDLAAAHTAVLAPLFEHAAKTSAFDLVCTLLRVGGLELQDWDAFQETRTAFADYDWILEKVHERGDAAARRVGLLMYCQAVETNAVHEILANLLRIRAGKNYSPAPLRGLGRHAKRRPRGIEVFTNYVPPSATKKLRAINAFATAIGCIDLPEAIDKFFDERIRNAFSHSDYTLTDRYFRFREGGLAQQLDVEQLDRMIEECFAFYGVFMALHDQWLHVLGRGKRFHKWPNYEVLELLSTQEEGLYGFSVHFSNGTKASYMRRKASGTMGSFNVLFDRGGITFDVGQLETLESAWKIDGKLVDDWGTLP